MTYHPLSIEHPFLKSRHDRSFSEPADAAGHAAPPAETCWLSGLSDSRAFDGLARPWWRWLTPDPAVQGLLALARIWRQRARMRRELAQIDPHTLRDAGIDPGAASFEAALPFWRAPIRLRKMGAD